MKKTESQLYKKTAHNFTTLEFNSKDIKETGAACNQWMAGSLLMIWMSCAFQLERDRVWLMSHNWQQCRHTGYFGVSMTTISDGSSLKILLEICIHSRGFWSIMENSWLLGTGSWRMWRRLFTSRLTKKQSVKEEVGPGEEEASII